MSDPQLAGYFTMEIQFHFFANQETSHLKLTFAIFLRSKGMNVIEMTLKTHFKLETNFAKVSLWLKLGQRTLKTQLKMYSGEKIGKAMLVIEMERS